MFSYVVYVVVKSYVLVFLYVLDVELCGSGVCCMVVLFGVIVM